MIRSLGIRIDGFKFLSAVRADILTHLTPNPCFLAMDRVPFPPFLRFVPLNRFRSGKLVHSAAPFVSLFVRQHFSVNLAMFPACEQLEIFNLIMSLVHVYVMDFLPLRNRAIEMLPDIHMEPFVSFGVQIVPGSFVLSKAQPIKNS